MPVIPWKSVSDIEPDRTYVALTSKLPLTSHTSIPALLRDTATIRRQLDGSPGLVGSTLRAQLFRKTFWTFSIWYDLASMRRFAAAEPHRQIMTAWPGRMGATAFITSELLGRDLPTDWRAITALAAQSGAVR
jgi:hypothetical protein